MKQSISKLLVVLSLSTFSLNSQAVVIVDAVASSIAFNASSSDRYTTIEAITDEVGWALICLVTLPGCLLNEELKADTGFTVQGLTEKGYVNAESLISEHTACMEKLKADGKELALEEKETRETIAAGMKKACNASEDLIDLMAEVL